MGGRRVPAGAAAARSGLRARDAAAAASAAGRAFRAFVDLTEGTVQLARNLRARVVLRGQGCSALPHYLLEADPPDLGVDLYDLPLELDPIHLRVANTDG